MKISSTLNAQIDRLSRFFETDFSYILKGGFWSNVNFVFTSLLGLTSSVLLARFVSKDNYGTYQFILAIANTIAVLAPNTMSSAVVRAVAKGYEGDFVAATKFQLRWGIIASLVTIGVSIWYAWNHNVGLSMALVIVALFMPTSLALNTWGAYLQGRKDYRRYFFFNGLNALIAYGGVIITIFIKPEFFWLAFANIVFACSANLILYRLTIKTLRPGPQTSSETIPYGVHLSLMGIPQGIAGQLDALLIFHFAGAAQLAIYSFATILPEKLIGGLKFIPQIIFPKFSEKSEIEVGRFFKKKIWWLMTFLAGAAILYAIASPYLFRWLFPAYLSSIPYTRVYALSVFSVAASVVQAALMSQKKTGKLYLSSLTSPVVRALLFLSLIPSFGLGGAIGAQIIAIFFQIAFSIYLLFHKQTVPA